MQTKPGKTKVRFNALPEVTYFIFPLMDFASYLHDLVFLLDSDCGPSTEVKILPKPKCMNEKQEGTMTCTHMMPNSLLLLPDVH